MKKTLLTLIAALGLGLTAGAAVTGGLVQSDSPLKMNSTRLKASATDEGKFVLGTTIAPAQLEQMRKSAPMREPSTMKYTLAGDPYTAIGFNTQKSGDEVSQAFEITASEATAFDGAKITAIGYYTGTNGTYSLNFIQEAKVWVAEDFGETPIAEGTIKFEDTTPYAYVNVPLNAPVTIEAGKPLVIGVSYNVVLSNDYPIVVDYTNHGTNMAGGWVGLRAADAKEAEWDNVSQYYGFISMNCTVEGENFPTNMVSIPAMVVSPVVEANNPFLIQFEIQNDAYDTVNSIEVECQVGDEEPTTLTGNLQYGLGHGEYTTLSCNATYGTVSRDGVPVRLKVTKVNGVENGSSIPEANATVIVAEKERHDTNTPLAVFTATTPRSRASPIGVAMVAEAVPAAIAMARQVVRNLFI